MIHFFHITNTFINVLIVSPCMLGLFHQMNNCFAVSDTTYMVKRVVILKCSQLVYIQQIISWL